ncbi:MAG: hypothetical protein Q8S56_04255, partial [Polaromonas sp.]|nr:hypothetical protein [Polaromonas sp.]
ISLAGFTAWVNQALEAESFKPAHPAQEQVVILPLSQLLGRSLQAVVLAGCDEQHLPVSPEPSGHWTPPQRELLGLPSREAEAAAQRAAWRHALQFSHLDLLWRESHNGERLMPSGFVQELLLQNHSAPTLVASRASGDALPLSQEGGAELARGGPSLRSLPWAPVASRTGPPITSSTHCGKIRP